METAPFKTNVRKLKALGLTISHDTGYELSPRGRASLATHRGPAGAEPRATLLKFSRRLGAADRGSLVGVGTALTLG